MANKKHSRFRLSVVFHGFPSCYCKGPTADTTLPENSAPSSCILPPLNTKIDGGTDSLPSPSLKYRPHLTKSRRRSHSSLSRRLSSALISAFRCCLKQAPRRRVAAPTEGDSSDHFKWRKDEKWHVVAKVYERCASDDAPPQPVVPIPMVRPLHTGERRRRRERKRNSKTGRGRASTSSADSGLYFSSDSGLGRYDEEEEETDTLVSSSRSFSTETTSSDRRNHPRFVGGSAPRRRDEKKKKKKIRNNIAAAAAAAAPRRLSVESESPTRLSVFMRRLRPCRVEGKVRESYAVVKRSETPYEDFKKSMVEMIMEKQIFEEKDLEQLLNCFLSLNSPRHHAIIVHAFTEIWETMFRRGRAAAASSSDSRRACRL